MNQARVPVGESPAPRARGIVPRSVWVLLALQPLLSLAYLLSVRWHWLPPTFAAPVALGMLPVAAAASILHRWGKSEASNRVAMVVVLVAAAEVGWSVLVAAMVGFAIALRSG